VQFTGFCSVRYFSKHSVILPSLIVMRHRCTETALHPPTHTHRNRERERESETALQQELAPYTLKNQQRRPTYYIHCAARPRTDVSLLSVHLLVSTPVPVHSDAANSVDTFSQRQHGGPETSANAVSEISTTFCLVLRFDQ